MQCDQLNEAERVLGICNACRYCEGFCAVFPAMELRRSFNSYDLKYLANLCHNCRDCYYACQYAPPHEFELNVPKALGELRLETYKNFSWPQQLKNLFSKNYVTTTFFVFLGIITATILSFFTNKFDGFEDAHLGPNSFYEIISYPYIVIFSSLFLIIPLVIMGKSIFISWKGMGRKISEFLFIKAHARAIWDILRLKYLDGGGHGCNYPDDKFRMIRRNLHHFIFYGFILCFLSTCIAATYDHFLHIPAPYFFLSFPVLFGFIGGLSIMIGSSGLLYLKFKMDKKPSPRQSMGLDISFLMLLISTSLTGILLLIFRETVYMGLLLVIHLGLALGLFLSLPYSKFMHSIYRYNALLANAIDQSKLNLS